jgi:O-antigen/teichoic acid export membrane protein
MTSASILLKNITSNYVGIAIQIVIAFLLSPFLVHTLGDEGYGIWTIVAALTGYMSLLDLGLSSAITRFIAEHNRRGEADAMSSMLSTAFFFFIALGGLLILCSPLISIGVTSLVQTEGELNEVFQALVIVVCFDVAIFVTDGAFRGTFAGLQRYDILNLAQILAGLYKAAMFYLLLSEGYGLLAMASIALSANIVLMCVYFVLLRMLHPEIVLHPRHVRCGSASKLYQFSRFIFISMLANQVIYYTDAFIIGYFMSAAAVTWYTIPWSLAEYTKNLCLAISRTFSPAFSERLVDGMSGLQSLYASGTRLMLIVSNLLCVGGLVLGDEFIAIWMGERYRELCTPVLVVLFVSLLFQMPQLISGALLQGVSRHQWLARVEMLVSVLNLILGVILVQHLGIVGVALGVAIPQILLNLVFVPWYTQRVLGCSLRHYFVSLYLTSFLPALALGGTLYTWSSLYPPDGYLSLLIQACVGSAFYLALVYLLLLEPEERRWARKLLFRKAVQGDAHE